MPTRIERLKKVYHILLTKEGDLLPGEKIWLEHIRVELTKEK